MRLQPGIPLSRRMVKSLIRNLEKAVRGLCNMTYAMGAIAIGLMMVHVVVHVFFQYVVGFPLPGTVLFVANYYMVVVTFICLAAVELKGGHISVDILFGHLPSSVQRVCAGIAYLLTGIVFILLTWQSFTVAQARRTAGTFEVEYGYKILLWPSYYLVPIGAALFAFTALVKLLGLVSGAPLEVPDADKETI
ncbi:TRAP transporter small permease [Paracoccus sp. P2]|uniref:TRAP transporter small permease n=1 Tax=Paracoccus sp. P2 TaxID=3248840 RepID=UPI00391FBDEE